jgi:hypothetical protein
MKASRIEQHQEYFHHNSTVFQHSQTKQLQGCRLECNTSLSVTSPFFIINTPALNFRFRFARFCCSEVMWCISHGFGLHDNCLYDKMTNMRCDTMKE